MRKHKFIDQLSCKISEIMRKNPAILDFISAKFVTGYPCVRPYIFSVTKISLNYQNSKWPLNNHFEIVCSQKLIRSLADIAEHIAKLKKKTDRNFFLERANEHYFVSGTVKIFLMAVDPYHRYSNESERAE